MLWNRWRLKTLKMFARRVDGATHCNSVDQGPIQNDRQLQRSVDTLIGATAAQNAVPF